MRKKRILMLSSVGIVLTVLAIFLNNVTAFSPKLGIGKVLLANPLNVGLPDSLRTSLRRVLGSDMSSLVGENETNSRLIDSHYDLSAHQTLSRVMLLIRDNYVEPERIKPADMFVAALDSIQKTVPEVMVNESQMPKAVEVSVGAVRKRFELGAIGQIWEVTMALRDIFLFLQSQIEDPQVRRDIEYSAINGMLSTLDPHSVLLKPENFDEVKLSTRGEFGGLGIVISIRDGGLTVISPIEGTPAANAGIKAKDKIVKIGEEPTINMALDEAVQKLRGKPGSKVSISVLRKSFTEPKTFVLARALIKIESVTSTLMSQGIGYVKIKSFQGNTYNDLQSHLALLRVKNNRQELKGLILDLRNNPGGLLDQAILVSDRFISKGPLVITVGEGSRKREVKEAQDAGDENLYPIAVLLNGGSASASEIVAGALKNHDRAVVLGQQSFGKGSVQVLYDFKDSSALKLTIAQYLTPGDISIQSVGITPDVQIVPAVVEKSNIHVFVDDDAPREKDLEKHLNQHGVTSVVEPSRIKITHLMPLDENGEMKVGDEEIVSNTVHEEDFETKLAHDMLLHANSTDRQDVLQTALPLFKIRAQEQEKIVSTRLGELGVDWRTPLPVAMGVIKPQVSLSVLGKSNTPTATGINARAFAGTNIVLRGSVTNLGDTPMYRVHGVTSSDNPLLKNIEFVFGKVNPQETRSWDVNFKIPSDMPERVDAVTLVLGAAQGAMTGAKGALLLRVDEPAKPQFAVRYRIDDSQGNHDGLLQNRERVKLVVEVLNAGPEKANDITLALKNLSGKSVALDQGRNKIGQLLPRSSGLASFPFTVGKATTQIRLRLSVWDGQFNTMMTETLVLPIAKPQHFTAGQGVLVANPKAVVPVYAGASRSRPVLAMLPAKSLWPYNGSVAGFYRLDLGDSTYGFVAQELMRPSTILPKVDSKHVSTARFPLFAPAIRLQTTDLVAKTPVFELIGTVAAADQLKDLFVFVNEKKVFYQANPKAAIASQAGQQPLAVPPALPVIIPFKIPIQLKPGSNNIVLFARQDDELVGHKTLGVYYPVLNEEK